MSAFTRRLLFVWANFQEPWFLHVLATHGFLLLSSHPIKLLTVVRFFHSRQHFLAFDVDQAIAALVFFFPSARVLHSSQLWLQGVVFISKYLLIFFQLLYFSLQFKNLLIVALVQFDNLRWKLRSFNSLILDFLFHFLSL